MTRVLLAGGGHTHLIAGPLLAARAADPVRVMLLAPEPRLLYSGMMPGWIAGQYAFDDCAIDLARVAAAAGIEWIQGTLADVDFGAREVVGADGRRYPYDLLSLNVGSENLLGDLTADVRACVLGAKPFAEFVAGWRRWLAGAPRAPHCLVAGGGPAGVEIACALAALCAAGGPLEGGRVELAAAGRRVLPGHSAIAAALAERSLHDRGVGVRLGTRHLGADRHGALLANENAHGAALRSDADLVIVATGARPPAWLGRAARAHGLSVAPDGGLAVRGDLRSLSDDRVFAGGDCASFVDRRVPKAGVHALRQGPVLAASIARRLTELEPATIVPADAGPGEYRPQRLALALLNRCDGTAIASWGPFAAAGAPLWRWKDRIDRGFVDRFRSPATPAAV